MRGGCLSLNQPASGRRALGQSHRARWQLVDAAAPSNKACSLTGYFFVCLALGFVQGRSVSFLDVLSIAQFVISEPQNVRKMHVCVFIVPGR